MDPIDYNSERLDKLLATKGETAALWTRDREDPALHADCPLSPELLQALEADPELVDLVKREIRETRQETLRRLFELIYTNGRHPNRIVPNIYALTLLACPFLMEGFTLSDIALLTSTTRQAECIRMRKWMARLGAEEGRHFTHPRKNITKDTLLRKDRTERKPRKEKANKTSAPSDKKESTPSFRKKKREKQLILPIDHNFYPEKK